jgi:hypothetical protein
MWIIEILGGVIELLFWGHWLRDSEESSHHGCVWFLLATVFVVCVIIGLVIYFSY